ncbi:unnamed protein product [Leuciscus chuanchicus]
MSKSIRGRIAAQHRLGSVRDEALGSLWLRASFLSAGSSQEDNDGGRVRSGLFHIDSERLKIKTKRPQASTHPLLFCARDGKMELRCAHAPLTATTMHRGMTGHTNEFGHAAAEMRDALLTPVRRFPWATNVTLYGCLFAGGDFVHQRFSRKEQVDWSHTRNVAVVAFSFHGNFNFFWMRFLERRFPGNAWRAVMQKLVLDQTLAAPLAISAFYTGVSFMEGRDEILQDWKEKFLNTYMVSLLVSFIRICSLSGMSDWQASRIESLTCVCFSVQTGLMYWPFMQFLNFSLVPALIRTMFSGCCVFLWAWFLCFSQRSGDGTVTPALDWIRGKPEPPVSGKSGGE